MTPPKRAPPDPPQFVITSIEPNDVVLGRGNHIHIDGNVKFRQLVHARSTEYWSCQDNFAKDLIARQIVDTITTRGGRFLRKVHSSGEEEQWELANKDTVLVKVKQTFRDFSASHRKQQSAAAKSPSTDGPPTARAMSSDTMSRSLLQRAEGEPSIARQSHAAAALPSDFVNTRLHALPPAPDVRELLLQELRTNQWNRLSNQAVLQQMSPQQTYGSVPQEDRPLQSFLQQASLLRLLQTQAASQESSLFAPTPAERQISSFLSSRQYNPAPVSSNPDVSDLLRLLQQQQQLQAALPPRSTAANLLNLPSNTTLPYQSSLQSINTSRLLEELSSQQSPSSQQLQQLLAMERRQVLPQYFQSSLESTIVPPPYVDRGTTSLNIIRGHVPTTTAPVDESPERKAASPDAESSDSELRGTD